MGWDKVKHNLFLIVFYGLHLYFFFFMILWPVGENIAAKCSGQWNCRRHIRKTEFGYSLDLGDGQWREFRNSLILLGGAVFFTSMLTHIVHRILPDFSLLPIRFLIGIIVLFIQHRYHIIIVLLIIYGGYVIAHNNPKSNYTPYCIWSYGIFILCFKESYRIQHLPGWHWLQLFFHYEYGGMYRWHLPMNFLVLRMISYGMDHYWAINAIPAAVITHDTTTRQTFEHPATTNTTTIETHLSSTQIVKEDMKYPDNHSCKLTDYNYFNYLTYMIYAPLYIAGPILSFNAFMKYEFHPQSRVNSALYILRWVVNFCLLEGLLAYFPLFAVIQSNLLFHLTPVEICVVLYLVLKMMWLKFLLLWRFFRAWCLLDGVYVEENMDRCMSNNYSLAQFWQHWHSTFNQWIVRYVYIPLGGREYQLFSVWIIFAFVALWHDLEWKLLLWGCLNSLFYSIELFVYKPLRQYRHGSPWYQWLVSCFGALYILILMMVNAIGYAVGTGGISIVMNKLCSEDGLWTLLGSFYFLMIGVNIMFYYESLFGKNSSAEKKVVGVE